MPLYRVAKVLLKGSLIRLYARAAVPCILDVCLCQHLTQTSAWITCVWWAYSVLHADVLTCCWAGSKSVSCMLTFLSFQLCTLLIFPLHMSAQHTPEVLSKKHVKFYQGLDFLIFRKGNQREKTLKKHRKTIKHQEEKRRNQGQTFKKAVKAGSYF